MCRISGYWSPDHMSVVRLTKFKTHSDYVPETRQNSHPKQPLVYTMGQKLSYGQINVVLVDKQKGKLFSLP
jgi:hypothetical protein